MASTASSSASTSSPEQRPQAEPIPVKRGEIGYTENTAAEEVQSQPSTPALPARHPADRDHRDTPTSEAPPATAETTGDGSSVTKPKSCTSVAGIRYMTLGLLIAQILLLGGSATAWAFAAKAMGGSSSGDNSSNNNDNNSIGSGATSVIFVHIVFSIATLGQLLFLERRVFRLRAERYAYLHPGEILPTSRRRGFMNTSIPIAPWNRPPIPTYAAALAESGLGTGDVEDHIIAQPPPPAYGNTRGSTLLLAGFLNETLRAQRPVSAVSARSHESANNDRPKSYMSTDSEWEIIQDADRARQLEETLATLERPRRVN